MKNKNVTSALILAVLLLAVQFYGCSDNPTDPELPTDEFFTFALDTGDFLIYQGPTHGLTIEGPDTVHWHWVDGGLFMGNDLATVRVRPLMPFTSEDMTDEMIERARARYTSVPFIDEWLEGNSDPTNEEWAEAYHAWLEASSEFSYNIKVQFRDDERTDRVQVVSDLTEQANNSELVVPGSAWFTPEEDELGGAFDIWMVLEGMPSQPDGSPDEVILMLRPFWDDPVPSPTTISEEDALVVHHGINLLFESSRGPLLIDLSSGWRISTTFGDE